MKRFLDCFGEEPVGSAAPKFPTTENIHGFVTAVGVQTTLLCPAQGYPVPAYR